MRNWLKVLAVLFVLPVFSFAFYEYAPKIVDDEVRESLVKNITENEQPPEEKRAVLEYVSQIKLHEVCAAGTEKSRQLIADIEAQSACEEFTHFQWAQSVALILIGLGLLHLGSAYILSQKAKASRQALLKNYKSAWTTATGFSLVILLGQAVLGAYTCYSVTTVLTHKYFPKLIMILLAGGGIAFYQTVKMLLSKVPLETEEPTSQAVTEADAPQLWSALRDLARKLEIKVPDTVLVGMSTSFYVTEFPVKHVKGVSNGRTLFLSAPMMKHLSKDEILAIIGHEFGHFKGEDTVFSNHMTPLLVRAEYTKAHMVDGGVIGIPALQAMNVFTYFFDKIISSSRRDRELLADACAASVTSPLIAARALVRYVYKMEAHDLAYADHMRNNAALEASLAKFTDELKRDDKFWVDMASQKLPHPYDSHPPLALRVEKLGFTVEDLRSKAAEPVAISGFDVLMEGKSDIIKAAIEQHESLVKDVRTRQEILDMKSEDLPVEVVREHFPQVTFQHRMAYLVLYEFLLGLLALCVGVPGLVSSNLTTKAVCFAIFLLVAYLMREVWLRCYGETLTLNHLGVQLSLWKDMLKFSDVAEIVPLNNNGVLYLTFKFKEKRLPLEKRAWFKSWKRSKVQIKMSYYKGNQQTNGSEILRYFLKVMKQ